MKDTDKSLPAPAPSPYLGTVDGDREGWIGGWAITREGDACHVVVTVNGHSLRAESDLPRADLAAKGESRGLGGWRISIRDMLQPGENMVEVVLPDGTPLAGSPRMVMGIEGPAPIRYRSAIDTATAVLLSGWAVSETGEPCDLTIAIGDAPAITVRSDGDRADLAASGISTGGGGWHLLLGGLLRPGANAITVTLPDGTEVAGSPLSVDIPVADQPVPVDPAPVALVEDMAGTAPEPMAAEPVAPETVVAEPVITEPERDEIVVAMPSRRRPPARSKSKPKPAMPSLVELDELSLDDLALAVASGRIQTEVESPPAPVAPVEVAAPVAAAAPMRARRGWMSRLRGR